MQAEAYNPQALGALCPICPAQRARIVPPEPSPTGNRTRLAVVGEGPGENEIRERRPFVGKSGKMLERGLATIGLQRSDVHWTNATLCPCNPQELKEAAKCCRPRLQAELRELDTEAVIVPVGGFALRGTIPEQHPGGILDWRGAVTRDAVGHYVLPTIHPAFAMRAPAWRPVLEADFDRVGRVMRDGFTAPEDEGGPLARIKIATTPAEVADLLARLGGEVAIDVETVGLGPTRTELVCLAIADVDLSVVIPWASQDGTVQHWVNGQRSKVLDAINDCLAPRITVTHNGPAFDHIVLRRYGIRWKRWDDTLLMAHATHSHFKKSLGFNAQLYLDVPPWKTWDHAETIHDLHIYNGRDSLYTARLAVELRAALEGTDQLGVYESDKVTAALCTKLQEVGFAFDAARAAVLAERLAEREKEIEAEAAAHIGRAINLLSPIQLGDAFFRDFGAPWLFLSDKTGKPSLGVDTLRAFAARPEPNISGLARLVIEYRRCRKVRKTYLENVVRDLGPDGRVHATWLNYGACSGRFSSQGPNLMNAPRASNDPTITHCRNEILGCGKKCKCGCDRCGGVRSCYMAGGAARTLLAFDAKQLEMRIAAYASQDPVMIAACESSDMHAANAEIVFGDAFRNATPDERDAFRNLAKSAGFAVCYMAQAQTVYDRIVASGSRVTLRQVEAMLRTMRGKFSVYYDWQARRLEDIMITGWVYEPIGGRRRWLGKEPLPTEAANFPIQGGAAALMNRKLPEIVGALGVAGLDATLVAQVHDSGTFDTRKDHVAEARRIIQEIFEAPIDVCGVLRSFPLDFKEGERWA